MLAVIIPDCESVCEGFVLFTGSPPDLFSWLGFSYHPESFLWMDFLAYSDLEQSTSSLVLTTLVASVQLRPHCCLHNSMPLIHIQCGVLVTTATSNFTIPHELFHLLSSNLGLWVCLYLTQTTKLPPLKL